MQIRRRGALLMGALLLLCGSSMPPASGLSGSAAARIDRLLQVRARAVQEGDREAFLATVGPRGSTFYRRQGQLFDRLMELPLADYRLAASWSAYGDLARPSDHRRYGGADDVVIPLTIERYRLAGFDTDLVPRDLYATFVERDGSWHIESDTDLDDVGFYSARAPWDLSDVSISASGRVMAIAGDCPGCPSSDGVVRLAEAAIDTVDARWDGRWDKKVPIFIPRNSNDLARMIEATYPVDNFVAFAFWTGSEGEHPGPRIIVNPDGFSAASAGRASSILTHETFHVAALPASGPFIPRWIDEGFAQYVQYGGSAAVIGASDAVSSGRLPKDVEFFSGTEAAIIGVYRESLSATGYMIDRWGWDRAQRLYVRLGRRGSDPGTARFHVDRTMRDVLGVGLRRFERLWASSIGA